MQFPLPTNSNKFCYHIPNNLSPVIVVLHFSSFLGCEIPPRLPATNPKFILVPQCVNRPRMGGEQGRVAADAVSALSVPSSTAALALQPIT